MDHWWISESSHDHSLFFQLFGDILGRWTRNINPCLNVKINILSNKENSIFRVFSTYHWEESAGSEHENNVKNSVHWVSNYSLPRFWWWKIIAETTGWIWSSWSTFRLKYFIRKIHSKNMNNNFEIILTASQTPKRETKKFPENRVDNICEMTYKLETRADWRIIGMFEV